MKGEWLYFYCTDYANSCNKDKFAYTEDKDWGFWRSHYINLCPKFFNEKETPDHSALLDKYKNDKTAQAQIENFQFSKATTILHETFHFYPTIADPRIIDLTYDIQDCAARAADRGTEYIRRNAESWTLNSLAIAVQQHYKLNDPPTVSQQSSTSDSLAFRTSYINGTTSASISIFPDNTSPDPNVWHEFDLPQSSSTTSTATTLTTPSASSTQAATPVCTGSATKWVPRDPLSSVIPSFCADAEKQGVQDKNSASIVRSYLTGGKDTVNLAIDWPPGNPWKPAKDDCIKSLSAIMDSCDIPGDKNPMNWKHGGNLSSGPAKYSVVPMAERGYRPGTCAFHLHEREDFKGVDGPGTMRTHDYSLSDSIKDGVGSVVSTVQGSVGFADGNPYTVNDFYAPLIMTPESQNGDYIQFKIGSQSWTTKDSSGAGRCNTGDWDSHYTPMQRDMDCFFPC